MNSVHDVLLRILAVRATAYAGLEADVVGRVCNRRLFDDTLRQMVKTGLVVSAVGRDEYALSARGLEAFRSLGT